MKGYFMKTFILSLLCAMMITPAIAQESKPCCAKKKYVTELGLVFPVKTDAVKDYINASNIGISPLTSGFSSGFQVGKHRIINERATLGLALGGNMFYGRGIATNQVYQLGAYLTGRLYFGDTWRNGVFAEVGAGPEGAATSLNGGDFQYQANIASRFGVGYNYQFNEDVTLGASVVVAPSIMADNYFDGAKVVVNMLW
jgi:hypothetical protein